MRAVYYDEMLEYRPDTPDPIPPQDEALIFSDDGG